MKTLRGESSFAQMPDEQINVEHENRFHPPSFVSCLSSSFSSHLRL